MKELDLLKERITQLSSLLPWWVNLILAEVSFVILYFLKSGMILLLAVPSLFLAASIIATLERDRQIQEQNRLQRQRAKEQMVTKIIVKDLMKGKYRESFFETGQKRQEEEAEDKCSNTVILSLIVITLIGSTAVMIKVAGKNSNKAIELVQEPATPQREPPMTAFPPPRPIAQVRTVVPERSWKQFGYSRTEPPQEKKDEEKGSQIHAYEKNSIIYYTNSIERIDRKIEARRKTAASNKKEEILSYSVIFKSGKKQFCIDAARMKPDMLTIFINESLHMEVPVDEIKYVEAWYEVDGKSRMKILSVDEL